MAVALLGIAVWAWLGVRNTMVAQLDQSVYSVFELERQSLAATGLITPAPDPSDPAQFVHQINRLVVVRDAAGRVVQVNHPLARELPLDTASARRALHGARVARTTAWRGRPARALLGRVPMQGGPAVLEVAASLRPLQAAARSVLLRMLLTAALGTLATFIGAYWLASSALAPVGQIARQAAAIHGTRTGQRITIHAGVAELAGLVQVLNDMLGRLERASEWHRRIIRDLGHDLRTPVATMRTGIEVALRGLRTPEQYRRVLADTMDEVDRLALLGEGLSLLGALESGTLRPEPRPTDLRLLVEQAVTRARTRAGERRVELRAPGGPLEASVDPRLLGIALEHLLDNAVRHTPGGTPIRVSLAAADRRLGLTVEDDGPGVAAEALPHLFDRFYRNDPARGRHSGAGLGLTTVAIIADLHHGRVSAGPGGRGGLRVTLDLPRA